MTLKKWCLAASAALALAFGASNAQAVVIAGNYGTNGYSVVNITTAGGVVDVYFNSGYGDPTLSLFNSSGSHLITNDDEYSRSNFLLSHLTQNLAAGNYSLLISYCCAVLAPVQTGGATFSSTDGFNDGSYLLGGSSTLSGVTSFLDGQLEEPFQSTYDITLTNATEGRSDVPEPGSLALMGLALAGLALRKKIAAR